MTVVLVRTMVLNLYDLGRILLPLEPMEFGFCRLLKSGKLIQFKKFQ